MNKIKIALLVFLLATFIATGCSAAGGADKGGKAPDFTLMNLKDKPVSLNSFKGNKAVLLVFWATWCPFCREEIPELKKIYSKYNPKGLEILAVSLRESKEKLSSFAKKEGINYPILIDPDGNVGNAYGVVGIPTNVIIDKQGAIQFKGNTLPKDYEVLLDKVVK